MIQNNIQQSYAICIKIKNIDIKLISESEQREEAILTFLALRLLCFGWGAYCLSQMGPKIFKGERNSCSLRSRVIHIIESTLNTMYIITLITQIKGVRKVIEAEYPTIEATQAALTAMHSLWNELGIPLTTRVTIRL